jgi:hypothetical protein
MKLDFDLKHVKTVEFGVGLEAGDEQTFSSMHVDKDVQSALEEMAVDTWKRLELNEGEPPEYEPSEKFAATEHVYLDLDNELAVMVKNLHTANNLDADNDALRDPELVFCYFARFTDNKDRRLTALRRAAQFKGVVKNRLIRLSTDALKLVKEKVFRLDTDFDLIADSKVVHILRPSGFEFAANLQGAVLAAVPKNLKKISKDLPYVDFTGIEAYAAEHPRAARYLASIKSQKETQNIDKASLKALCKTTHVTVKEVKGKIIVDKDNALGFLEVLDRRRYQVELISGSPEQFKAGSRAKL